eukprot:SAG25_NODE_172_length_13022_cov_64.797500_3_plen_100_part_00
MNRNYHLGDTNQCEKFPMPPATEELYVDNDDYQLGACMEVARAGQRRRGQAISRQAGVAMHPRVSEKSPKKALDGMCAGWAGNGNGRPAARPAHGRGPA